MTFGEIAEIRYRKKVDLHLPSESTLNVKQAATAYGVQRSLLQAPVGRHGQAGGQQPRGPVRVFVRGVERTGVRAGARCGGGRQENTDHGPARHRRDENAEVRGRGWVKMTS